MKIQDKEIQLLVGRLLRYGVFIASGTVLLGGLYYMYLYGGKKMPQYNYFSPGAGKELLGAEPFNATKLIEIGVLLLIATPILRVVFSLFAFILEKDKRYIIITLIVLCIIAFNIFYGLAG